MIIKMNTSKKNIAINLNILAPYSGHYEHSKEMPVVEYPI